MATPPGVKYFPYSSYRAGQEEIIEANRSTIRDRGLALLESPTGTGKTLNAIVPGLEAVERGEIKGIMFVTPRKTQHAVVFDDVRRINKQGHEFRVLNLVSKSDLCINENGLQCAYGDCRFMPGKGGQTKLGKPKSKEKIQQLLGSLSKERPSLDVPTTLSFGKRVEYCPHRAVLDFAHEAEVVVCDYNYVFSPAIANIMAKKEMEYGKRLLVVDEGHNLYDRVLAF
ncbi:MAG: DEAD/DEAH box helicase family protein, partial [Methanopyri archaeon]|nr:DEAD/DEAH box helicase family protein [Methanopyri archaeon]